MKYSDREARSARRDALRNAGTKDRKPRAAAPARKSARTSAGRHAPRRANLNVDTTVAAAPAAPPTPTSPRSPASEPEAAATSSSKAVGLGLRMPAAAPKDTSESSSPAPKPRAAASSDDDAASPGLLSPRLASEDAAFVAGSPRAATPTSVSPSDSSSTPLSSSAPSSASASDAAALVTPATSEPLVQPLVEPLTDPTTDPLTDPTTDPLTDPMTDPTTDPLTDPLMDPLSDALSDLGTEFAGELLDAAPAPVDVPGMTDDEFESYMQDLDSSLNTPASSAASSGAASPVPAAAAAASAGAAGELPEEHGLDAYIDYSATCDGASAAAELGHKKRRIPLYGYRDRRDASMAALYTPNKRSVLAAYWTVAPDMVVSTREAYEHSVLLAAASLNHRSMLSGRARQTMAPAMGTSY